MKIKSLLFALIMMNLSFALGAKADSFVDVINAETHADGQQVIYEMNVGMFTSEGTFAAAQEQLAELKTLGVDIVWLMPIYPRGGGINSPYAAVDFKQVNSDYGDIASLTSFVTAAHNLGMKVWLDWVPNHMATNATWVTTNPEYFKKDSSGNMIHPYNGAWSDVWQLDYTNADLVNAMNDCLKFWVNEADIDGYRCDYVSSPEIPSSYWVDIIAQLRAIKPSLVMMAETDLTDSSNSHVLGAPFDYDYAWDFQTDLTQFGASGTYANPLKVYVQDFLDKSVDLGYGRMVYLTNHDQNWNEENQTLTQKYGTNRYLLEVLIHTIYGMPLIYNGEEIGGNQALNYFEDTKIDRSSVDYKMYNTLRTLNALKHSQAALHDGKTTDDNATVEWLTTVNGNQNILAYRRTSGDSEVIVLLNAAATAQTAIISGISGTYSQWLNSETIDQDVSRKSYTFSSSLSVQVPAKGYLVYVKGEYADEDIPEEQPLTDITTNADCDFFYETPVDKASITAWVWAETDSGVVGGENYASTGAWPGDYMERLGITEEGNVVYHYVINVPDGLPEPQWLIVEENGTRIYDGVGFVNHGYYIKGQDDPVKIIPAGINDITVDRTTAGNGITYDLMGRQVDSDHHGIVIRDGKKYLQ